MHRTGWPRWPTWPSRVSTWRCSTWTCRAWTALARQLRLQGFAPPLIAVTARADAEAEQQARAAGFDGFLRKPVTGDMLAAAIEAVLPEPVEA